MINKNIIISAAKELGGRAYQADSYLVAQINIEKSEYGKGTLMAVADGAGQGGAQTADIVIENIKQVFSKAVSNNLNPENAVKETFSVLQYLVEQYENMTTLSMLYFPENSSKVFVGIIGDSPIFILNSKNQIIKSPEHNISTNYSDSKLLNLKLHQILPDSEYIVRGWSLYQLTRAIGGNFPKALLLHEPEVYTIDINPLKFFVLIASDGIFDKTDSPLINQTKRVMEIAYSKKDALNIVKDSVKRKTMDNVTCILSISEEMEMLNTDELEFLNNMGESIEYDNIIVDGMRRVRISYPIEDYQFYDVLFVISAVINSELYEDISLILRSALSEFGWKFIINCFEIVYNENYKLSHNILLLESAIKNDIELSSILDFVKTNKKSAEFKKVQSLFEVMDSESLLLLKLKSALSSDKVDYEKLLLHNLQERGWIFIKFVFVLLNKEDWFNKG